jgi:hypothetical protein
MSALGFFSVGRENMVGLLSTMLTYLIILIQFDQVCEDTQQLDQVFAHTQQHDHLPHYSHPI